MLKTILFNSLLCCLPVTYLPAQIVYTDISDTVLTYPDSLPGLDTVLTNYFHFDLDQDEENDYYFYASTWKEWISPSFGVDSFYVLELNVNDNQSVAFNNGCAIDFSYGEPIGNVEWYSFGIVYLDVPEMHISCNIPYEDRYLGLRLTEGNDHFYGWIRLDASWDSLVLKDFAYNSTPNGEIFAGQMETAGITSTTATDGVSIHVNKGKLFIYPENHSFSEYSLITLQGRQIESGTIDWGGTAIRNTPKPGCYLVRLSNRESMVVKKVILR